MFSVLFAFPGHEEFFKDGICGQRGSTSKGRTSQSFPESLKNERSLKRLDKFFSSPYLQP
jgi:hypothetical protein